MRMAERPCPMKTTDWWTCVRETAARMELRNQGELTDFSKVAAPFTASANSMRTPPDAELVANRDHGSSAHVDFEEIL